MSDDIRKLALTMKISARTVGVARNNIYLVLSAKLLIASLALCGLMPLTAAGHCGYCGLGAGPVQCAAHTSIREQVLEGRRSAAKRETEEEQ